jgi:anti-sigma B factor antagonist
MPPDFDVRSEPTPGGGGVLHVTGELDLASAPRLEDAMSELDGSPIVIDLSECTFLDSAGMRVLLAGARELSDTDRSLRVVTSDPRILRVLEITGVDTLIAVHGTVDDALD